MPDQHRGLLSEPCRSPSWKRWQYVRFQICQRSTGKYPVDVRIQRQYQCRAAPGEGVKEIFP